ncbi:sigma-54 interaction domain-containing protein [Vibrio fluvialis]|uniref:sigma-54 interaction domain-containing protein n=1 Tax=Vibrio fluvialis TaxID=676 RepID=UPI001559F751|nr:sigma-54 dependent transcriptional regulator [Vibrio fluvialis]ELL4669734.1 sigma-54-dependent Fis family transcriptional regulator [Vibrio fluvialis]MBY8287185.1 sigma-54 dependent transcriptional regulator [Vibrio fluvialis]MCE7645087.1 sigma-54 dependent transcriptional regulator [Vibrio fluvialis]
MSNWLAFTADLVGLRKPHQLATRFVDIIAKELGLSNAMLLMPSSDGRLLVPHDERLTYSWAVTDFDNPFAHVLQSSKAMHLTAEELVFWQSNRTFSQLVSKVGMFDSVWIQPLPMGHRHVQSILLLIGESHVVANIFQDDAFLKFIDVFSQQWSLLHDMEREEQNRRVLKESLCDIQRDSVQRVLVSDLSRKLIGDSEVMQKLREQIVSAASSNLSVMVQGETGTGKELAAEAVHDLSSRKHSPFVAINCAAIPENLLESELFGYCKGAFSGADSDKQGLIAQANGGTLFLDEIGDMPLALQAKLLRVLESKTFRPVGGKQELTSDFRLVSATHVNLLDQVRRKAFRQDLYYRLFQYPITLPRLASRLDDVDLLAQHFVRVFNQQHGKNIRGLHYSAIDCLKQHDFPGNVRELKHLIEFGCAQTADGTQVEEHCFTHRIASMAMLSPTVSTHDETIIPQVNQPQAQHTRVAADHNYSVINDLKQALSDFEEKIIRERLNHFSGDRAKAAQSLGIPKRTLAYKCQKLEIKAL